MTLADLLNTPATIIRRRSGEEVDERGNSVPVVQETEVLCWIEKRTRAQEEPGGEGELSDTLWMGYFPAGTELGTGDAVVVEPQGKFEMVGDPWEPVNPRTGEVSHIEASLRRTAGSGDAA